MVNTTERGFSRRVLVVLVVLILFTYFTIEYINIDRPFYAANDDDNTSYGLAAYNQAKFGFLDLKFGMATSYFDSAQEIKPGHFYTNHPQWFVVPTALSYKVFGLSEAATRLPIIIFALLSIVAFYLTISIVYSDKTIALFSTAAYALFPGFLFYCSSLSEKAFIVFFSNFVILSFFLLQTRKERYLKAFLMAMIVLGGMMGWHFYFAITGLWLYALLRQDVKFRKFLLISMPLVSVLTILLNFLHFYILKGAAFLSIFDQFIFRSARIPLETWIRIYSHWLNKNFTWVAVLIAIGFLIYVIYLGISQRKFNLGLVYLTQPLLVILVFQQWTVHGFGGIYWVQFIALALGFTLSKLVRLQPRGLQIVGSVLAILLIALCSKYGLDGYRDLSKEFILGRNDIKLLKDISTQTPPDVQTSIGRSTIDRSYRSIAEWYVLRDFKRAFTDDEVSLFLAFHPDLGAIEGAQIKEAEKSGYKLLVEGDFFLLYARDPASSGDK